MTTANIAAYPHDAHQVVNRYLTLVDRALPGRIDGLYLVGSIALSDYHPGPSDVDFVAVTGTPVTNNEIDCLREIHATLRRLGKPWFDGIYVTWDDLTRNPSDIEHVPFSLGNTFGHTGGAEANPSVWLTLRNYPFAIRGRQAPTVWYDESAIRRWNLANLNSYWRGVADRLDKTAYTPQSMDWETVWCVAGVARLHYTITSLNVTSKSGACRYALAQFPGRWHTVIREAQGVRNGGHASDRSLEERRKDVRDFVRLVIDDAAAQWIGSRVP